MASSEAALDVVRLCPADLDGALALSDAAGWNQTADDWRVFLADGHVAGCRAPDGTLVATAAALPYERATADSVRLGWVSMVLVRKDWQHRGLATLLMRHAVDFLRQGGIVSVLDATPAGEPVYARMGFERGLAAQRWEADLAPGTVPPQGNAQPVTHRASDLRLLDQQANGIGRGFLIDAFLARAGSRVWLSADGQGFVIVRQGRRAAQLGPLVAANAAQALDLLATALSACTGRVFLDALQRWPAVTQWLQAHGFTVQRPFVRMALGPLPATGENLFVLAGPEFG